MLESGSSSGVGLLASFTYNDLGARTGITRGNGVSTAYGYDAIGRLQSLTHSGATNTQAYTSIGYDPASEMLGFTTSNGAYAWAGGAAATTAYAPNSLNQYTGVGGLPYTYDAKGNLATMANGGPVFHYDSEDRLVGQTGGAGASLAYYPDGSLWKTAGSVTTQFLYDGDQIIGEYDGSGALLRRYVPGPGVDEPLVWYEGGGIANNRRWLMGDHQGSVIAWADTSGSIPAANINTYDEYGQPGSGNLGRFQYTGQPWIPEIAAYDYRARDYLPGIGRFMQTDPKGYEAGLNLYAYVDDDPVDKTDPMGMSPPDILNCPNHICPPEPQKPPNDQPQDSNIGDRFRPAPTVPAADPRVRPLVNAATRASNSPTSLLEQTAGPLGFLFRGLRVHIEFAKNVRALGGPYSAEVSYKGGRLVPYGTIGSVRADAVFGPINKPAFVVELKTGAAVVSQSTITPLSTMGGARCSRNSRTTP